jgi:nucleoside-diphosphate-sugar epimerase
MNITIFGATGKTGLHLVRQALAAGHNVTAFARTPEKLGLQDARLRVVQGDVTDAAAVARAVEGADVVISALGPSSNKPVYAVTQGMKNIVAAMQQHGVQRLVVSAGAGVGAPGDKPKPVDRIFGTMLGIVSRNVVADMKQAVATVRDSGTQWTVVRVPMLTDDPATGKVRVGMLGGDVGIRLSREDMARWMLEQADDTAHLRALPVISN